jgi:hypothetical protein
MAALVRSKLCVHTKTTDRKVPAGSGAGGSGLALKRRTLRYTTFAFFAAQQLSGRGKLLGPQIRGPDTRPLHYICSSPMQMKISQQ